MSKKKKTPFFSSILKCDHKMIGTFYLVLAIISGLLGAVFSLLLRLKLDDINLAHLNGFLSTPSDELWLFILNISHAIIFIFFTLIPALMGGFGNWFLPLMLGAKNVAFPKLNYLSFGLLVTSFILTCIMGVIKYSGFEASILGLSAIYLAAFSFIIIFINFIVTIVTMRAPGLTLSGLPIFVWSILIASFLGLIYVPAIIASIPHSMNFLFSMRNIETDVQSFYLMMWFYTHPELYVLLLPAFGIISQIIISFCKRALWGERFVIVAMIAMGGMGLLSWMSDLFRFNGFGLGSLHFVLAPPIMLTAMVFILGSWFMTLLKSHLSLQIPLYWVFGFLVMLFMGLISMAQFIYVTWFEYNLGSSNYIAHFHYLLSLNAVFAIFAAWYYWLPKMTGYQSSSLISKLHFWSFFIGSNAIFIPQYLTGSDLKASYLIAVSLFGASLSGVSVFIFLYNLADTFLRRRQSKPYPWGKGTNTLEWQLPSPPKEGWILVPRLSK